VALLDFPVAEHQHPVRGCLILGLRNPKVVASRLDFGLQYLFS
jgi:hypothetical protein